MTLNEFTACIFMPFHMIIRLGLALIVPFALKNNLCVCEHKKVCKAKWINEKLILKILSSFFSSDLVLNGYSKLKTNFFNYD